MRCIMRVIWVWTGFGVWEVTLGVVAWSLIPLVLMSVCSVELDCQFDSEPDCHFDCELDCQPHCEPDCQDDSEPNYEKGSSSALTRLHLSSS